MCNCMASLNYFSATLSARAPEGLVRSVRPVSVDNSGHFMLNAFVFLPHKKLLQT